MGKLHARKKTGTEISSPQLTSDDNMSSSKELKCDGRPLVRKTLKCSRIYTDRITDDPTSQ